jgi:MFS family permease
MYRLLSDNKTSRRPLGMLFFALFNSVMGLSILFPVLAPLGRKLGLSEFQVGSLSAAYAGMQLLASPVWGRQSERRGRKPILLLGICGFAASFYLFALAAELGLRQKLPHIALYAALLGARLVGGTFSSATMPTAQAYVADVTERSDRTSGMAVIGAAFGLGIIVGPGIGAGLAHFGLLTPVYASASLAVVNALFVWWRLPEPERASRTETQSHRPGPRRWLPLLALALLITLAAVSMEQTIAFSIQDRLHLSAEGTPRQVGIALVVYGLVAVFVQGFLVRRFGWSPRTLLRLGAPIAAVGLVGLAFAQHFPLLTAALAVQGCGQGLALPGITSAISLEAPDDLQGVAAGYNSSAQALGRLLGPLIGTGLYQWRPPAPYLLGAAFLLVVVITLALRPRLGVGSD